MIGVCVQKQRRKLSKSVTQLGMPPLMGRLTFWIASSSCTSLANEGRSGTSFVEGELDMMLVLISENAKTISFELYRRSGLVKGAGSWRFQIVVMDTLSACAHLCVPLRLTRFYLYMVVFILVWKRVGSLGGELARSAYLNEGGCRFCCSMILLSAWYCS